jgi:hypothetical protein
MYVYLPHPYPSDFFPAKVKVRVRDENFPIFSFFGQEKPFLRK